MKGIQALNVERTPDVAWKRRTRKGLMHWRASQGCRKRALFGHTETLPFQRNAIRLKIQKQVVHLGE